MANSFKKRGITLTLTAPYNRLSGQGALIGALFCVALEDVLSGAKASFGTEGVHELDKAGSQAWTEGQRIFWDNAAKVCTNVAEGNHFIGVCETPVGSGAGETKGRVKLAGPESNASLQQAANVTFTPGANLVGVDGAGNNAAPLVETEARLDALDTAVAAILTALKDPAAALMAPDA